MGLRLCKMSFRSLRDLFLVLIFIAVLSSMMTFHMTSYLPWLQSQPEFKIHVDGHLNIYRSLQLNRKIEDGIKQRILFKGGKKMSEEEHALINRLLQLEDISLPRKKSPLVIVAEGSLSAIKHEVPLLESAFSRLGAKVEFNVKEDGEIESEQYKDTYDNNKPTWRVLMCLNTSRPNTCRDTGQNLDIEDFKRANVIPALHSLLFNPQLMCQGAGNSGHWQGGPLPCYKLLEQTSTEASHTVSDRQWDCGNLTVWVLHAGNHGNKAELVKCDTLTDTWNRERGTSVVAVKLPPHLFHTGAQPLVIQFHILVMSFSPLRLYLHSEALTWEGISSYLNKKPQRSLTVAELQQLITEVKDQATSLKAVSNLEEAIVSSLMQLEFVAEEKHTDRQQSSCARCFQLLEVTTVFNTSFHPFILQIKPYTHSDKLASLNEYLVRQRILEDMAAMLVARESVVMDLMRGLSELGLTNIYNEGVCNTEQSFCLSKEDLIYSLNNRREQLHKANFVKLYPSTSSVKYTHLLQNTQNERMGSDTDNHSSTAELHSYLLSLESYFAHMEEEDSIEVYDDVNVPIDFEGSSNSKPLVTKNQNIKEVQSKLTCNNDPASMPYLLNIVTKPGIQLVPEFSPFTTEYHATVQYEMLLVTVWAFAKSCSSQARLEDKHGSNREANFTLGIGENRISIYVVDMSHADPWVLNTYTLLIHRQGPDYQQTSFVPGIPHQICSLKQDCSLKFLKSASCGLHRVPHEKNWSKFVEKKMSLPYCQNGDTPGQWYVPCTDCNDSPSCYWQQALWQPDGCSYNWLPRGKVQQCFSNKKVLFIGDSTNRGILHYITEQVNGTLLEWDKTHQMKVYTNLNRNNTVFSFAYYPQFWLPTEHRPVFDKALYQLIKKNIPLENNTNTVLVIGGVHWLAKHHIDVVIRALNREGLTGIKLLVKGLGAGFHQSVSGVHCLTQKDHQRLLSHNQAVLKYAKQNGFSTVDTFNMTMARYKDFLQGKCACHFHRVTMTKAKSSTTNGGKRESHSNYKTSSPRVVYHVEGEINAVYSEMTINQICRPS